MGYLSGVNRRLLNTEALVKNARSFGGCRCELLRLLVALKGKLQQIRVMVKKKKRNNSFFYLNLEGMNMKCCPKDSGLSRSISVPSDQRVIQKTAKLR